MVKIISLILIILFSWIGLASVTDTIAYLNDEEEITSTLAVSVLDFSLNSPSDFSPSSIFPGESAMRNVEIINNGIAFKYIIKAEEFSGTLCDYLLLEANLGGGEIEYFSGLNGFEYGPVAYTESENWSFAITLLGGVPDNITERTCQFKFIVRGSQIGGDLLPGQGFNDIEEISNNITVILLEVPEPIIQSINIDASVEAPPIKEPVTEEELIIEEPIIEEPILKQEPEIIPEEIIIIPEESEENVLTDNYVYVNL